MPARIALAGLAAFVLLAPATASGATARDRAGDVARGDLTRTERKALDITRVEAHASSGGVIVGVRLAGNAEKALGRGHLRRARVTVTLGDAVISTRGRSGRRAVDRHSGPGGRPIVIRSGRRLTFVLDRLDGTKIRRAAVRTSAGGRGDRAGVTLDPAPREVRCARSRQLLRRLEAARDALTARIAAKDDGVAYLRAQRTLLQESIQSENRNLRSVCLRPPTGGPGPSAPPPGPPAPPPANVIPDADFSFAHGASIGDPAEAGPITFDGSGAGDSDGTIVKWEWKVGAGAYAEHGPQWTSTLAPGHWLIWLKVTDDRGAWDAIAKQIFVRGPGERTVTAPPIDCPVTADPKPVTLDVRVPSWARAPYTATLDVPAGQCPGAVFSTPDDVDFNLGNDLGEKDAWGRPLNTVTFEFTITGSSSGTTTPSLTAAWQ